MPGPAEAAFTTGNLSTCRVLRLTGNRAVGGGGGIYDDGPEAMVTLTHSSGRQADNCEPLGSITGCTG